MRPVQRKNAAQTGSRSATSWLTLGPVCSRTHGPKSRSPCFGELRPLSNFPRFGQPCRTPGQHRPDSPRVCGRAGAETASLTKHRPCPNRSNRTRPLMRRRRAALQPRTLWGAANFGRGVPRASRPRTAKPAPSAPCPSLPSRARSLRRATRPRCALSRLQSLPPRCANIDSRDPPASAWRADADRTALLGNLSPETPTSLHNRKYLFLTVIGSCGFSLRACIHSLHHSAGRWN